MQTEPGLLRFLRVASGGEQGDGARGEHHCDVDGGGQNVMHRGSDCGAGMLHHEQCSEWTH